MLQFFSSAPGWKQGRRTGDDSEAIENPAATAVGESKTLQFRMDAPDILNHPELNSPTLNITNASFGTINGKTTLRRQFQAQLRLTF